MKTEIVKKSLSPTWDQTLIFDSIEIYGNTNDIAKNPPQIVIEVFDHDYYVIKGFCNKKILSPLFINIYKIIKFNN